MIKKIIAKLSNHNRNYLITKAPFREICEVVVGIDNKSPLIKFTRISIRFLVRAAGYKSAARVLDGVLFLIKRDTQSRVLKYIFYILELNKIRVEYLGLLFENQLTLAVLKKNQWAEFTLKDSMSLSSRMSAKRYLSLLSRHGYYAQNYDKCEFDTQRVADKKFYIFGPNASVKPSTKYKDYVLVLMKPVDMDISFFEEKILFANSAYYSHLISNNENMRKKLIDQFQGLYVSCRQATLCPPFVRSKFPIGDQLASPMALGRVLYNLINRYGKFSCVIEGFDFYLDKSMYSTYYPTPARKSKNEISEQVMCNSLAEHDALYNFLYAKELVGFLNVVDSLDFKKVISLSGTDYLNDLSKIRNFRSLR
jgi:hypothetical protein